MTTAIEQTVLERLIQHKHVTVGQVRELLDLLKEQRAEIRTCNDVLATREMCDQDELNAAWSALAQLRTDYNARIQLLAATERRADLAEADLAKMTAERDEWRKQAGAAQTAFEEWFQKARDLRETVAAQAAPCVWTEIPKFVLMEPQRWRVGCTDNRWIDVSPHDITFCPNCGHKIAVVVAVQP